MGWVRPDVATCMPPSKPSLQHPSPLVSFHHPPPLNFSPFRFCKETPTDLTFMPSRRKTSHTRSSCSNGRLYANSVLNQCVQYMLGTTPSCSRWFPSRGCSSFSSSWNWNRDCCSSGMPAWYRPSRGGWLGVPRGVEKRHGAAAAATCDRQHISGSAHGVACSTCAAGRYPRQGESSSATINNAAVAECRVCSSVQETLWTALRSCCTVALRQNASCTPRACMQCSVLWCALVC